MIYKKTALGQTALHNRSFELTPRQRSAFIMFDGKRDEDEVLITTSGLGVTPIDIIHLLSLGLLEPATAAEPSSSAVLPHTTDGRPPVSAQTRYLNAYPIATRLTAELGLRGFRLNLAIETAADLNMLRELAPQIRDAVGPEKFLELENALYY